MSTEHDMEMFRIVARAATAKNLPGAFPTFHVRDTGSGIFVPAIFPSEKIAEWRDVSIRDLKNVELDNFGRRFRYTQDYAVNQDNNKFVGGFPNFYHATYPDKGLVCGTILLRSGIAIFRNVPQTQLANADLDDVAERFRQTDNYAVANGYLGGFPTFFHENKPGVGIVCGTILIPVGAGERSDVLVARGLA